MKEVSIKLYELHELSDEARAQAVIECSDINTNYRWWGDILDNAKEVGVLITGFDFDRRRHIKGQLTQSGIDVALAIKTEYGESTEIFKLANECVRDFNMLKRRYGEDTLDFNGAIEALDSEFEDRFLNEYLRILEEECIYLESEEGIIEAIEANNVLFMDNGKIPNFRH